MGLNKLSFLFKINNTTFKINTITITTNQVINYNRAAAGLYVVSFNDGLLVESARAAARA